MGLGQGKLRAGLAGLLAMALVGSTAVVRPLPASAMSTLFRYGGSFPTDSTPVSVATAEFRQAGLHDLATANATANTITVLLNKGDGTMLGRVATPVSNSPSGLAVGDFNGDGKPDIAVAIFGGNGTGTANTVAILLGNGDATFKPAVNYPVGTSPTAVAVGDFNGDGKLDLAVANRGDNSVSVLLGNGDGTFRSSVSYPVGSLPESVVVADFNGDGKQDLAVANSGSNTVALLLGHGDGTFVSGGTYATGTTPVALATGDFNRDGKQDLAVANYGSNNVSILLGNGDGTFQSTANIGNTPGASSLVVGDFNAHGILDLAIADRATSAVTILTGVGDGTFTNGGDYSVQEPPASITAGDFDGDGTPDLATANPTTSDMALLLGIRANAFAPALSNGAYGGYVTAINLENVGIAATNITITYFNQQGIPVGRGDSITGLPPHATWTVRQDNGNAFPSGQAGSAVISSDSQIAGFVNEFAPRNGDGSSYSLPRGAVSATLYAPAIANGAYGGYFTGIGLMNAGATATNVTITYRGTDGAIVATQSVSGLAGHAYRGMPATDASLPAGFAGTATISSSDQPLAAIVNEVGPGGQFSSYVAVNNYLAANTTGPVGLRIQQAKPMFGGAVTAPIYAPVMLNGAFGGYYTGIAVQNTTASADTVQVSYFDTNGVAVKTIQRPIAAYGYLGIYQGDPSDGPPPSASGYTALIDTVTSSYDLVAIVNETAPGSSAARQSTAYNALRANGFGAEVALVENTGPDGFSTGLGIMSEGGTAPGTVTVGYRDAATGNPVGTGQQATLAPYAFWALYQPTGGLPPGIRATATVTGGVIVVCNMVGPGTFMSYEAVLGPPPG